MRVTAHIDLAALNHNFQVVRKKTSRAKILAMVKANAYGHGLVLCANNLPDADYLGIASLVEARALREAGLTKKIVFMPGIQHQEDCKALREYDLETVIYDERQLELLSKNTSPALPMRVWFKIDTGMHRLGCDYHRAENFLQRLEKIPGVEIVVVMTHLACADDLKSTANLQQLEAFDQLTRYWSYQKSALNSAGILHYPEFQYNIVRPGLMLYGASPTMELGINDIGIRPVMELSATIFGINHVPKGDGVGYGLDWRAKRDSRIAVISVGYGDGYPQIANRAEVLIRGQLCPVVGRVSMDFLTADVTDLPAASLGDSVLLWGRDLLANTAAGQMDVSVYRLLTGVMERVPRSIDYDASV